MSQEIKPALVVIDMEEGFLNENSPLYIKHFLLQKTVVYF